MTGWQKKFRIFLVSQWPLAFGLFFLFFVFVFSGEFWHFKEEPRPQAAAPDTDDPFALGQYYFNEGDPVDGAYDLVKARHYYEEALRNDPAGNSAAWYQLGRIDFLEGKFDAALYKFAKQTQYFEDQNPNVYYMIGLVNAYKARETKKEEDWQKAEEAFQKFLTYFPDNPWGSTDLSWVHFMQGAYEEMKPVLEKALEISPHNPWLLNMYGLALLNTDKKTEASEYFVRAKEEAEKLTVEDWGRSYPGNDPNSWRAGLEEFLTAIERNLRLSSN